MWSKDKRGRILNKSPSANFGRIEVLIKIVFLVRQPMLSYLYNGCDSLATKISILTKYQRAKSFTLVTGWNLSEVRFNRREIHPGVCVRFGVTCMSVQGNCDTC